MDCGACSPDLGATDPQMPERNRKVFVVGREEKKWQVCGAKAEEAIGGEIIRNPDFCEVIHRRNVGGLSSQHSGLEIAVLHATSHSLE